MKNLFKLFVPMAAAAIALVSCESEVIENNTPVQDPSGFTICLNASVDDIKADSPEAKTYIGTYQEKANTILWGTDEYVKLAVTAGQNTVFATSTYDQDWIDNYQGKPEASFGFTIGEISGSSFTYQALYPASAAVATNNTNPANYKVNLLATQNATATSYDPAAYIMVAQPETFNSLQGTWGTSFRRATALNKITLKNVPSGVSVKRVKITVTPDTGKTGNYYLAGGRHINLATSNADEVLGDIYSGGGRTETVEVKFATPQAGGADINVWFTSWGVELGVGDKLTIVAYTTNNKSYTKDYTLPANKTIKFQEGYLNTLGVSMSGITPEDVTELEEGNYLILAKDGDNYYALKAATAGSSNDKIASVAYTGSTSSYNGDANMVWSVTKSSGSYIIANGTNYVGWSSGNTAEFKPADENWTSTNYLIDIVWDSTNSCYTATLKSDSTRKFQKNIQSDFFAFYASTQKDQLIFVPATALETVATPTFSPAAGEVASGTEVSISCATSGATIHYTVDGTDPSSSSATYSSPIEITATTTIKVIAVKDGMADSEVASATYTVQGTGSGWELVSDFSSIVSGDKYMFVKTYNNKDYYMSSETATSAGGTKSYELTEDPTSTSFVTDDNMWFILTGDTANGFTAKNVDGKTLEITANNNGLKINTTATTLFFEATANNGTILKGSDGSVTRYIGGYQAGNFRCYTSVNANITACSYRWYHYIESGTSTPTVATPTFNFVSAGNKVSISCATDGATIYYTTNGADPTTSSNVYSEAISLSDDQMTIKAFATKSGYDDSAIASTTYYAINRAATTNGSIFAVDYAAEGDEVTITVTPDSGYTLGTLSVTDSSSNAVSVSNNKFTMPASPVTVSATFALIPVTTIADALGAPGTYEVPDVAVYAVKGNALILGDASGKIYAYKSPHGLSVGDVRTVSGSTVWYNNGDVYEFDAPTFSGSGTTTINHGTAVEFADNAATLQTETGFASTGSGAAHTAVYVHAIGDQSGRNITTSNGKVLYLSATETATDGKTVEVYGYVYAYSASHTSFNFLVTSIEEYVDPNAKVITALKSSITGVSADGVTNATESGVYSLTNASDSDVTVTPDGTVVTSASVSGGALTYSVAANTGSARSGSVTLAVSGGNSIEITISQDKASSSTGGTMTIDFENAVSNYSDWTFTNITGQNTNSNVTAHGGSYYGANGSYTSATITTKSKIDSPSSIVFYISKQTTNTNATSYWLVKVSSDGSTWTQVGDNQSAAANITRGTWYEVSRDLSSYSNVYVRIEYSGSNTTRCIDDVSLSYN